MIWINPEKLSLELKKSITSIYVLFGNNLFLLQDCQLNILKAASALYHIDNFNFKLHNNFDWNNIFNLCKMTPLFSQRKILSLHFPTNYPISLLNKKIPLLYSLIHANLILISLIYIPNQFLQEYKTWIQPFNKRSAKFINCMIPDHIRLDNWIKNQSKHMKMVIENSACQLLRYYYEGNNVLLYQTLQHLSLIYPDGNLSYERVKKVITDSASFSSNSWIESILIGNKQRANRILKELIQINNDLLYTLLRKIQDAILIITQIKYSITQKELLHILLKNYQIYNTQRHRMLFSKATQRLSIEQLNYSISLLVKMELKYYKNYMTLTKSNFELLTEILCNNKKFLLNKVIVNNIV